eukprot:FR739310.1.p1 GENE.FR739310.1~~FR739310.1.p1  ORF type:complete len:289 (+),score=25.97 FR739310.1:85-867(+)
MLVHIADAKNGFGLAQKKFDLCMNSEGLCLYKYPSTEAKPSKLRHMAMGVSKHTTRLHWDAIKQALMYIPGSKKSRRLLEEDDDDASSVGTCESVGSSTISAAPIRAQSARRNGGSLWPSVTMLSPSKGKSMPARLPPRTLDHARECSSGNSIDTTNEDSEDAGPEVAKRQILISFDKIACIEKYPLSGKVKKFKISSKDGGTKMLILGTKHTLDCELTVQILQKLLAQWKEREKNPGFVELRRHQSSSNVTAFGELGPK